jgi:hypothetical protein
LIEDRRRLRGLEETTHAINKCKNNCCFLSASKQTDNNKTTFTVIAIIPSGGTKGMRRHKGLGT